MHAVDEVDDNDEHEVERTGQKGHNKRIETSVMENQKAMFKLQFGPPRK